MNSDSLPPKSRNAATIQHHNTIDYEKILNSIRRSRNDHLLWKEDFKSATQTKLKFFTRKTASGSVNKSRIKTMLSQHSFAKECPTEKELSRIMNVKPRELESYVSNKDIFNCFDETMLHPISYANRDGSRNTSPTLSKNSMSSK